MKLVIVCLILSVALCQVEYPFKVTAYDAAKIRTNLDACRTQCYKDAVTYSAGNNQLLADIDTHKQCVYGDAMPLAADFSDATLPSSDRWWDSENQESMRHFDKLTLAIDGGWRWPSCSYHETVPEENIHEYISILEDCSQQTWTDMWGVDHNCGEWSIVNPLDPFDDLTGCLDQCGWEARNGDPTTEADGLDHRQFDLSSKQLRYCWEDCDAQQQSQLNDFEMLEVQFWGEQLSDCMEFQFDNENHDDETLFRQRKSGMQLSFECVMYRYLFNNANAINIMDYTGDRSEFKYFHSKFFDIEQSCRNWCREFLVIDRAPEAFHTYYECKYETCYNEFLDANSYDNSNVKTTYYKASSASILAVVLINIIAVIVLV